LFRKPEGGMTNAMPIVFYAAAAGAGLLVAAQLALLTPTSKAYQAASGFFVVLALLSALNAGGLAVAGLPVSYVLASAALLGALTPLLRLYVDDLVSDVPLTWRWKDLTHFAPAVGMAGLAVLAMALPPPDLTLQGLILVIDWAIIMLTVLILLQGAFYVYRVLGRFAQLQSRLKQVLSVSAVSELFWLRAVTALFVLNGLLTLVDNVGLMAVSELGFAAPAFAFTLVMGVWSVRQAPLFQPNATNAERLRLPESPPQPDGPRYERSLLDDDRLERIAARIEAAFAAEKLHLDPNLSLRKLAAATGVSEINLSQTFSRFLGASFFDYVNARRVAEARALLESSDDAVVTIAVAAGFNSRSAFYTAFKELCGQTPAAYRTGLARPEKVSGRYG